MSTTAGYFDETKLQNIRVMLEDFTNMDVNVKKQHEIQADSLKFVLETQTAKFKAIENPKKDNILEMEWLHSCDIVAQDCVNCTMEGAELSSNIQEVEMNICKEASFYVKESEFINNDFGIEQAIVEGSLRAEKRIIDSLNPLVIAAIEANLGVNLLTTGKATVAGTVNTIAPALWDASLFAYFQRVKILNQMKNPVILDGSNLFEKYFVAKAKTDNFENNMFGSLPYYSDLAGIDAYNNGTLKTYLIDRGTIAIGSKIYYPELVNYYDGKRYSVNSQLLPGLKFDVYYTNSCLDKRYKHVFKYVWNGVIITAPADCTATNTGMLAFTCG